MLGRLFIDLLADLLVDFWCYYLLTINSPKRGGGYAALLRFGYPTKFHENKTTAIIFHPASIGDTPTPGPFKNLTNFKFHPIPWGEFKVEVIFFPRGAPRGDPQGGVPRGGIPWGGSGELFGLPTWRKNLRIRPQGYLFMLRSILILPDLEIPLKTKKTNL